LRGCFSNLVMGDFSFPKEFFLFFVLPPSKHVPCMADCSLILIGVLFHIELNFSFPLLLPSCRSLPWRLPISPPTFFFVPDFKAASPLYEIFSPFLSLSGYPLSLLPRGEVVWGFFVGFWGPCSGVGPRRFFFGRLTSQARCSPTDTPVCFPR